MRLRRETGDFEIKVTSDNSYKTTINKNLNAEDLIGQIVNIDGGQLVITKAVDNEAKTATQVTVGTDLYVYTKATGAFAKSE